MQNEVSAQAVEAVAAGPAHLDMSAVALFMQADTVVKAVMIVLLLASVWCWAVILDKLFRLSVLRAAAAAFEAVVAGRTGVPARPLAEALMAAATHEWRDDAPVPGYPESRAERRQRIEAAMRGVLSEAVGKAMRGLPVLATTASAAPFIGLFGTVWGIMNSFTGIANSQDTSLAVVAPGIAEALFATAMGLVAAIPAVIAYNKLSTAFAGASGRIAATISRLAAELSRHPAGRAPADLAQAAE
ncbi:MAG: MotA/TolQ/ExbB proton channel family protein [Thalassobaculales bacterium]